MTEWQQRTITDYWDERARAIAGFSQRLGLLPEGESETATKTIAESVAKHVAALQDEQLKQVSYIVADDLYKAACAIEVWSRSLVDYLTASAGTFFRLVRDRGYVVRYIVDNTVPDFERVLSVFPGWFNASEIVYICPQYLAKRIMNKAGVKSARFVEELPRYIREARYVANTLVLRCAREHRHFIFLDVDSQSDSFMAATAFGDSPGVITIFRNEAPTVGSNVQVRLPDGPEQSIRAQR